MSNREEFEKWLNHPKALPRYCGITTDYVRSDIQDSWVAWQATCELKDNEIAALHAELDALKSQEPVGWYGGKDGEYSYDLINLDRNIEIGTDLYAHPVPAIPTGYRVVPVEPTEEMIDSVMQHIRDDKRVSMWRKDRARIYKAMIAASQKESR